MPDLSASPSGLSQVPAGRGGAGLFAVWVSLSVASPALGDLAREKREGFSRGRNEPDGRSRKQLGRGTVTREGGRFFALAEHRRYS